MGLLKLALHTTVAMEKTAAAYYHRLGFELSRMRDIEGVHVLEFYLNLYEVPREEADGE